MKKIGKFEVIEMLGRGAMGMVFKGFDRTLNRHVAVKVMTSHLEMDPELRARFLREAQAAGSLHHPNIITVFELGDADGQPYIAMEYVPGRDLDDIIEAREALTVVEKVDLIEQVLRGLTYAHERQIIHRDIKPANIRVSEMGQAKIMDFGVAHLMSSELTQTGSLMGTPFYMSPEVVEGKPIDARSDIFSVGATFYELLSYSRPFQGETLQTVFQKILNSDPPPLRELGLEIPPLVQRTLDRSLAKLPANRYASTSEMLSDLMQFWETIPAAAQARAAASTALGEAAARAATAARRKKRVRRLIPLATGTAAATALVLLIAGAFLWRNYFSPPTGTEPVQAGEQIATPGGPAQPDPGEPLEQIGGPLEGSEDAQGPPADTMAEAREPEPAPQQAEPEPRRTEPERQPTRPRPDPARRTYETARRDAEAARDAAVAANAPSLASAPFQRAQSLRQEALTAARAGRYSEAATNMQAARSAYGAAESSATGWRVRLDSAWQDLARLRTAAVTSAAGYGRAEELRRQAESSETAGDPAAALAIIASAAEAYRSTMAAAQPTTPEPAAAALSPDEITTETLAALRRAIRAESLERIREVWVSLSDEQANNFESFFAIARELDVEFEVLTVNATEDLIEVTVRTRYVYFDDRGRRQRPPSFEQWLQLAPRGDRWIVVRSRG